MKTAKSKALKKVVEHRGNLKVTHQGNSHTYEPNAEQAKKNKLAYEEKIKKFPNAYK